jgi:hypothetical protein
VRQGGFARVPATSPCSGWLFRLVPALVHKSA